jgi:hypothetical protein
MSKDLFGEEIQTMVGWAQFSDDRKYRYALYREWDQNKPLVMFIGLNPSTANETESDPTIRRVIRFAKDWGYGGLYMMNLFALVSPDPTVLIGAVDAVADNDYYLQMKAVECEMICFVWGAFPEAKQRAAYIASRFKGAYCMGKTKDGHPKHPLYLPAITKPELFVK